MQLHAATALPDEYTRQSLSIAPYRSFRSYLVLLYSYKVFILYIIITSVIFKLELELPAIEPRIVLVDNPVVIGTDDNDVRGVVVLRTGEVVDVVG